MNIDTLTDDSISVNMFFVTDSRASTTPAGPHRLDGGDCCTPLAAGPLDEEAAIELAAVLKAVADPVRLRLLALLAADGGTEVCACDLPLALDRAQPTISHHLTQLVGAGLVEREQRGKWAWFRLTPGAFERLGSVFTTATRR